MSDIAIRVEKLSKKYRIGRAQQRHDTLRDALSGSWRGLGERLRRNGHEREDEIWALRDVSFEVQRGEVVGVIGRNGAGKSTLLKILSQITEPTSGRAEIHGRVGSLLEVGTGFHPELTGRENIYLSGAMLGMRRAEIERKFDEIVDFSGVEKFIDTPIKRYSSGMNVRLGFAVAAHLEPEILLVDEVLAVGDAAFQKKCLGKMGDVAREGRTVLFVSHNMAAVLSLCGQCYLIDQGLVTCGGTCEDVVAQYMQRGSPVGSVLLHHRTDRDGDARVRLTSLSIRNGDGAPSIRCNDSLRIRITFTAELDLLRATFLVGIYDQFNRPIFFLDSGTAGDLPDSLPASGSVCCVTGPVNLTPGACIVNVAVMLGGKIADHVTHATTFEVEAEDFFGTGKLTNRQTALCLLKQQWELEKNAREDTGR